MINNIFYYHFSYIKIKIKDKRNDIIQKEEESILKIISLLKVLNNSKFL